MAIHDVEATALIMRTAQELKTKGTVKPPEWAAFVKTGMSRERQPVQGDWWFIRSASIMRKLFILGPVGTSKLRVKFGGKKNRGVRPGRFYPSSGNHLRKMLQQLEKAGLAKQVEKGVHKGRVLTPAGHQLLEKIASEIMKEQGLVMPKKPDVKIETPKKKRKTKKKSVKRVAKKRTTKKKAAEEKKEVEAPAETKTPEKKEEKPAETKTPEKKEEKPAETKTPEKKEEKPAEIKAPEKKEVEAPAKPAEESKPEETNGQQ